MDIETVVKALKAGPAGSGYKADLPGGGVLTFTDTPDGISFHSNMGHSLGQIMEMVNQKVKEMEDAKPAPPSPKPEPVHVPDHESVPPKTEEKVSDGMAKGQVKKTG